MTYLSHVSDQVLECDAGIVVFCDPVLVFSDSMTTCCPGASFFSFLNEFSPFSPGRFWVSQYPFLLRWLLVPLSHTYGPNVDTGLFTNGTKLYSVLFV